MKLIGSTDYFAIIPNVVCVGLSGPSQQSGAQPFQKPAKLATPKPIGDEAYHERVVADVSLLALIIATAVFVTIVILNWSH